MIYHIQDGYLRLGQEEGTDAKQFTFDIKNEIIDFYNYNNKKKNINFNFSNDNKTTVFKINQLSIKFPKFYFSMQKKSHRALPFLFTQQNICFNLTSSRKCHNPAS